MSQSKERTSLFPFFHSLNKWMGRFLTGPGQVLAIASVFFAVGSFHVDSPVYYLCGACLTLLLFSYFVTSLFQPKLYCSARVPSMVKVGQAFNVLIVAQNKSRWQAMDLEFSFADQSEDPIRNSSFHSRAVANSIAVDGTTEVAVPVRATKRGAFSLPTLIVQSSFPFQLFCRRAQVDVEGELIVVPKFAPLQSVSWLNQILQRAESSVNSRHLSGAEEFFGSREFAPGMAVRRWDYAAWARTSTPYVRQYESTTSQQCVLLVDTQREYEDDSRQHRAFEALLSLAASIGFEVERTELEISLAIFGSKHLRFEQHCTEQQLDLILWQLAHTSASDAAINLPKLESESMVIYLAIGTPHAATIDQLNSAGHSTIPVIVGFQEDEFMPSTIDYRLVSVEAIENGSISL